MFTILLRTGKACVITKWLPWKYLLITSKGLQLIILFCYIKLFPCDLVANVMFQGLPAALGSAVKKTLGCLEFQWRLSEAYVASVCLQSGSIYQTIEFFEVHVHVLVALLPGNSNGTQIGQFIFQHYKQPTSPKHRLYEVLLSRCDRPLCTITSAGSQGL